MNSAYREPGVVEEKVRACDGCGRDVPVAFERCTTCQRVLDMCRAILWSGTRVVR